MNLTRLSFAASAILFILACSDDATSSSSGGGGSGAGAPAEVIYEAEATDEALDALLEASVVDDADEAAYITAPADGATLAAGTPPTFEWQVGPPETGTLPWTPGASDVRLGLAPAPVMRTQRLDPIAALAPALFGVLAPAGEAHAHGTPVNGRGYLLVVTDASGAQIHRVFTLDLEHTPTTAAWASLASSTGPFEARVTNAVFESNKIVEGGGPFEGPAITFTVE